MDVIEEHAAREQLWTAHVRSCADAAQLELGGAIAREVLAVASAVLEHAEAIAPFLAVPAERLALVDEASAVHARNSHLLHRGDVDSRERAEELAENPFVERRRAPERAELENRFEHDTVDEGDARNGRTREGASGSARSATVASYSTAVPMMPPENVRVCWSGSTFVKRTMICMPTTAVFRLSRTPTPTSENIVAGIGSKLTD